MNRPATAEAMRSLVEELVALVPEESERIGIPILTTPTTGPCTVEALYRASEHTRWPYRRIEVAGRSVGLGGQGRVEDRDVLQVTWPAETPSGTERVRLHVPPFPMEAHEYEVYLRLRRDGTPVDRAAGLAAVVARD